MIEPPTQQQQTEESDTSPIDIVDFVEDEVVLPPSSPPTPEPEPEPYSIVIEEQNQQEEELTTVEDQTQTSDITTLSPEAAIPLPSPQSPEIIDDPVTIVEDEVLSKQEGEDELAIVTQDQPDMGTLSPEAAIPLSPAPAPAPEPPVVMEKQMEAEPVVPRVLTEMFGPTKVIEESLTPLQKEEIAMSSEKERMEAFMKDYKESNSAVVEDATTKDDIQQQEEGGGITGFIQNFVKGSDSTDTAVNDNQLEEAASAASIVTVDESSTVKQVIPTPTSPSVLKDEEKNQESKVLDRLEAAVLSNDDAASVISKPEAATPIDPSPVPVPTPMTATEEPAVNIIMPAPVLLPQPEPIIIAPATEPSVSITSPDSDLIVEQKEEDVLSRLESAVLQNDDSKSAVSNSDAAIPLETAPQLQEGEEAVAVEEQGAVVVEEQAAVVVEEQAAVVVEQEDEGERKGFFRMPERMDHPPGYVAPIEEKEIENQEVSIPEPTLQEQQKESSNAPTITSSAPTENSGRQVVQYVEDSESDYASLFSVLDFDQNTKVIFGGIAASAFIGAAALTLLDDDDENSNNNSTPSRVSGGNKAGFVSKPSPKPFSAPPVPAPKSTTPSGMKPKWSPPKTTSDARKLRPTTEGGGSYLDTMSSAPPPKSSSSGMKPKWAPLKTTKAKNDTNNYSDSIDEKEKIDRLAAAQAKKEEKLPDKPKVDQSVIVQEAKRKKDEILSSSNISSPGTSSPSTSSDNGSYLDAMSKPAIAPKPKWSPPKTTAEAKVDSGGTSSYLDSMGAAPSAPKPKWSPPKTIPVSKSEKTTTPTVGSSQNAWDAASYPSPLPTPSIPVIQGTNSLPKASVAKKGDSVSASTPPSTLSSSTSSSTTTSSPSTSSDNGSYLDAMSKPATAPKPKWSPPKTTAEAKVDSGGTGSYLDSMGAAPSAPKPKWSPPKTIPVSKSETKATPTVGSSQNAWDAASSSSPLPTPSIPVIQGTNSLLKAATKVNELSVAKKGDSVSASTPPSTSSTSPSMTSSSSSSGTENYLESFTNQGGAMKPNWSPSKSGESDNKKKTVDGSNMGNYFDSFTSSPSSSPPLSTDIASASSPKVKPKWSPPKADVMKPKWSPPKASDNSLSATASSPTVQPSPTMSPEAKDNGKSSQSNGGGVMSALFDIIKSFPKDVEVEKKSSPSPTSASFPTTSTVNDSSDLNPVTKPITGPTPKWSPPKTNPLSSTLSSSTTSSSLPTSSDSGSYLDAMSKSATAPKAKWSPPKTTSVESSTSSDGGSYLDSMSKPTTAPKPKWSPPKKTSVTSTDIGGTSPTASNLPKTVGVSKSETFSATSSLDAWNAASSSQPALSSPSAVKPRTGTPPKWSPPKTDVDNKTSSSPSISYLDAMKAPSTGVPKSISAIPKRNTSMVTPPSESSSVAKRLTKASVKSSSNSGPSYLQDIKREEKEKDNIKPEYSTPPLWTKEKRNYSSLSYLDGISYEKGGYAQPTSKPSGNTPSVKKDTKKKGTDGGSSLSYLQDKPKES